MYHSMISCIIKDPICSSKDYLCANKIEMEILVKKTENCLPPCSGLLLTSYTKTDPIEKVEDVISSVLPAYSEYTKWYDFPSGLRGCIFNEIMKNRVLQGLGPKIIKLYNMILK